MGSLPFFDNFFKAVRMYALFEGKHVWRRLGSQSLSAFGSPSGDDPLSGLGLLPHKETMGLRSLSLLWLVCN